MVEFDPDQIYCYNAGRPSWVEEQHVETIFTDSGSLTCLVQNDVIRNVNGT